MSAGSIINRLRYQIRRAVYCTPLARLVSGRGEPASSEVAARNWDAMMTGGYASYLDRTISVGSRDALLATLIRSLHPKATSLLDLGCGAGTLAEAVAAVGVKRYEGRDLSGVAISRAGQFRDAAPERYPPECRFETGDIRTLDLGGAEAFDAIVFSEVLYYLGSPQAAAERVHDCMRWLAPGGIIGVSMKDDPKSHAVFDRLACQFEWVAGMLFQEKFSGPEFRVRINRERPGFLVAVLRGKQA